MENKKVVLGVLGMDKKIYCEPMERILGQLNAHGEFHILRMGEPMILEGGPGSPR